MLKKKFLKNYLLCSWSPPITSGAIIKNGHYKLKLSQKKKKFPNNIYYYIIL